MRIEGKIMENKTISSSSGLQVTEELIMKKTVDLWNLFLSLEQTHPSDVEDICEAVNRIQDVIGIRAMRRLFPDLWATIKSPGEDETFTCTMCDSKYRNNTVDRRWDCAECLAFNRKNKKSTINQQ